MHDEDARATSPGDTRPGPGHGLWVAVPLLVLAGLFYLDPLSFQAPAPPAPVPAWAMDTSTVRQRMPAPEYSVGGFSYSCQECHKMWPREGVLEKFGKLHNEIILQHGINHRCLNCHNKDNRDTFAGDEDGEISWNEPQLLCASVTGRCIATGSTAAHGRSEGYWDPRRRAQIRRRCIECHDPHRPPFPPLHPAPPPDTLRMGRQDFVAHEEVDDPLHLGSKRHNPGAPQRKEQH